MPVLLILKKYRTFSEHREKIVRHFHNIERKVVNIFRGAKLQPYVLDKARFPITLSSTEDTDPEDTALMFSTKSRENCYGISKPQPGYKEEDCLNLHN